MSRTPETDIQKRIAMMEQLQYLGQMQSTETAHFHQTAASANGVNITDSKTLSVLMQEGAMTAGQLAVRLSLTTGAVTNVIDRLEQARLVQRTTDPDDRRRVIVSFNHHNAARLSKTYHSIGQSFARLLETYSNEQLAFLIDFMQASIEISKQETRKLID